MADYAEYYNYVTSQGVIVPDTKDVLEQVQNEWKDVFGLNLSVEPETPQGRIIEMIARQRVFTLQMAAATSNMLNLDKSYGFILDDIAALFQIQRKSATHTTTLITMSGVDGTVIPVGTKLRSDDGYVFVNKEEYTIGTQYVNGAWQTPGTVNGTFEAEETGVIPAEVGTITNIVTSVNGLETVVNNANATMGTEQESDAEFKKRIKDSLNINSTSILTAIKSAVANVDGVIQVKAYENTSETGSVLNTIFNVPGHGVGIIVDYIESNQETQEVAHNIAEAIYKKKTLGAAYITVEDVNATIKQTVGNSLSSLTVVKATFKTAVDEVFGVYNFLYDGSNWKLDNTTVTLSDYGISYSGTPEQNDVITVYYPEGMEYLKTIGYIDPYDNETHNVTFAKPIDHRVYCTITVKRQNYSGDDLEGDIKDVVSDFLSGNNPEVDRVGIGEILSPFEIAAAVSSAIPDIFISAVTIGNSAGSQSTNLIQLGAAERLVINREDITVSVAS